MWKCNSESTPLGVATISQTPSNQAATETPILQAQCLQSPSILLGEGGVWTAGRVSERKNEMKTW